LVHCLENSTVETMRRRIVLACLGLAVSAAAVLAQSDPVKEREDLMKQNDRGAKSVVAMMRADRPPGMICVTVPRVPSTTSSLPSARKTGPSGFIRSLA